MACVIKCVDLIGMVEHGAPVPIGQYLVSFNPEANDGRGDASWSHDVMKARRFDNPTSAMELYRYQPKSRPFRDYDGRPNRPLTAFTIEIVPLVVPTWTA